MKNNVFLKLQAELRTNIFDITFVMYVSSISITSLKHHMENFDKIGITRRITRIYNKKNSELVLLWINLRSSQQHIQEVYLLEMDTKDRPVTSFQF